MHEVVVIVCRSPERPASGFVLEVVASSLIASGRRDVFDVVLEETCTPGAGSCRAATGVTFDVVVLEEADWIGTGRGSLETGILATGLAEMVGGDASRAIETDSVCVDGGS